MKIQTDIDAVFLNRSFSCNIFLMHISASNVITFSMYALYLCTVESMARAVVTVAIAIPTGCVYGSW